MMKSKCFQGILSYRIQKENYQVSKSILNVGQVVLGKTMMVCFVIITSTEDVIMVKYSKHFRD